MNNLQTNLVKIQNLTKKFKNLTAVNDLSLEINIGEIVGFLGPNGAGKSTTIAMLSTILKPTSGSIFFNGYNIIEEPNKAREKIGVCPQETVFYDYLTISENCEFFAKMHSKPASKEKVKELVKELGLEEKLHVRASTLSGGMKRRLNVLLALIMDPEIVFLDEPSAGLDPQASRITWDFIRNLRNQKKTVLVTTHNMREAEELCDRIYIIDNGKIIAQGTPQEIKANIGDGEVFDFKLKINDRNNGQNVIEELKEKFLQLGSYVKKVEILGESRLLVVATGGVQRLIEFEKIVPEGLHGLANLTIRSQNLEDVFLLLTGRELRE